MSTSVLGTAGFSVVFDTSDLTGQFISATATDPLGNTSEFSISQPVISKGLPVITTQPQSQQVDLLSTVALRVVATGNQPFSYQWQFNGSNLAGATNDTLIVSNVLLSLLGNYSRGGHERGRHRDQRQREYFAEAHSDLVRGLL